MSTISIQIENILFQEEYHNNLYICYLFSGQISNANHHKEHIGSPNRNRELGNRPRSGLWQRKTGRFGRKIRPPPPLKIINEDAPKKLEKVSLVLQCLF